jgi:putative flippase GtrA
MNGFSPGAPYWGFDVKSKPTHSEYFWYALTLSFTALLGLGKLCSIVNQNHHLFAISAPLLLIFPILIVWQAVRTIRAVHAARAEGIACSEPLQRQAAAFLHGYVILNVFVGVVVWLLISLIQP